MERNDLITELAPVEDLVEAFRGAGEELIQAVFGSEVHLVSTLGRLRDPGTRGGGDCGLDEVIWGLRYEPPRGRAEGVTGFFRGGAALAKPTNEGLQALGRLRDHLSRAA